MRFAHHTGLYTKQSGCELAQKVRDSQMENTNPKFHSQLTEKHLYNGRIAIYTKINNFKCGELDLKTSAFYSVHRTSKNVMRMYCGLGLNEELLTRYRFKYIIVPYNSSQFKTTRLKWIRDGIKSPFCNDSVDSQIILPLSKINLIDTDENDSSQLSLFNSKVA